MKLDIKCVYRRLLVSSLLMLFSTDAQAEITVTHGEYKAGVLVVRGQTSKPQQRITLDGRYSARTNEKREFLFRIRYLPKDCVVRLEAGLETRVASITNCKRLGSSAAAVTTGAAPSAVSHLRVVRQPCTKGSECNVVCNKGEVAINAFCSGGEARLISERSVSCGVQAGIEIVAYCMTATR